MKKSMKLMVAIAVLTAGNAVAGNWRFANASSYSITIGNNAGDPQITLASKYGTQRAVSTTATTFNIASNPASGQITLGKTSFTYGKIDSKGKMKSPVTVDYPAGVSASNPPVFVIDVGVTTGFKVVAMTLNDAQGLHKYRDLQ